MSVSEPQRLALHRAARAALGEEEGDTLMALSPPSNTDIATRQDLQVVRSDLLAEIQRMNSEALRWTVGTIIAANLVVVGLLTLILR